MSAKRKSEGLVKGTVDAVVAEARLSGIRNILAVANGDESCAEAARDVARSVALKGGEYFAGEAGKEISRALAKSSSKLLRNVANAEIPVPVIQLVSEGSATIVKYFRGELTGDECLDHIGELSFTTVSGAAATSVVAQLAPNACALTIDGIAIVPMATTMIAAMVASAVFTGFKNYVERNARVAEQREKIITERCQEACRQLRMYRRAIERRFGKANAEFYDLMAGALADLDGDDVARAVEGGNSIVRALGMKPVLASVGDLDQLMDGEPDLVIGSGRVLA